MHSTTLFANLQLPSDPLVLDLGALVTHLAALVDPRARRGLRYPLEALLAIGLLAKLSGASQLRAMARWARCRARYLSSFLGLARPSMPHHSTFTRVFAALDPLALDPLIGQFFADRLALGPHKPGEIVLAIDGKTLRGTIPAGKTAGVHLVAAYLPAAGVVVAQLEVSGKANELSVAPKLLQQFDLGGVVVTGDALFAQRNLSAQIVAARGEYLWTVKGNQAELREDSALLFAPLADGERAADFGWRRAQVVEAGHGRLEERTILVSSTLKGYSTWPGLEQVFQITCQRTQGGKTTQTIRYGVTSLTAREASPRRLLALTKEHWGIEGGLHQRRDVTLGEDASQVRTEHAPHILASLNNCVVGLVVGRGRHNLAEAQSAFGFAFDQDMLWHAFQHGLHP